MIRLIPLLFLALKVWMLIDASRRKAPQHWYYIIIFVPFGGLIYFVMVKAKDFNTGKIARIFKGSESLKDLKIQYQETPSLDNKLRLAQALYDHHQNTEAEHLFAEVLERYADNSDALHGLGLSRIAQKNFAGAIEPLKKLTEINPTYLDYVAWPDLAWSLHETGCKEEERQVLRDLVKKNPVISHQMYLAQHLANAGEIREAVKLLESSLFEHERSPSYVKKRNADWASRARKLLKKISA